MTAVPEDPVTVYFSLCPPSSPKPLFLYPSLGLPLGWPHTLFTVPFAQHRMMNISGVELLNGYHVHSGFEFQLYYWNLREINFIRSTHTPCDTHQMILTIVKDIDLFKAIRCFCILSCCGGRVLWSIYIWINFAHSLFCPSVCPKLWYHHHLAVNTLI